MKPNNFNEEDVKSQKCGTWMLKQCIEGKLLLCSLSTKRIPGTQE